MFLHINEHTARLRSNKVAESSVTNANSEEAGCDSVYTCEGVHCANACFPPRPPKTGLTAILVG